MVGGLQGPRDHRVAGARHECLGAGGSLDITPSQLFGWRRAAALRAEKIERQAPAEPRAAKTRRVEIELGGAVVRVNADISEADLRRLLRAVREA